MEDRAQKVINQVLSELALDVPSAKLIRHLDDKVQALHRRGPKACPVCRKHSSGMFIVHSGRLVALLLNREVSVQEGY